MILLFMTWQAGHHSVLTITSIGLPVFMVA